ncbi:MAG TPA: DUF4097 family beta strand repeat-containing protein [Rhodanobacteraceae bacterium]|nr:DUF4097 family beta strand repeat-containing protein [Rhodanobacteraceae bacterium]
MHTLKALPLALLLIASSPLARADTPINASRPLNRDAKVSISNVSGEVTVHGWDQDRIEITGSLGDGAKPLIIKGDRNAIEIKVEAAKQSGWLNWGVDSHMKPSVLDIRLPRGVTLDIDVVSADATVAELAGGAIDIDSVSGRVRIDANSPKVTVDSVSGNVDFRGQATQLDIETVSGDIQAPAAGSREASLETVSGDVHFQGAAITQLDTSTVSGDLALGGSLASGGSIKAESMSGDVTLDLPGNASAKLEASSFSGRIESGFGDVKEPEHGPGSSLNTTLGAGDGRIHLESFSGDIRIRRAN